MSMPLHYKDKREELDSILWHFDVPKSLFHRLLDLRQYMIYKVEVHSEFESEKVMRAIELIDEIMPRIREEIKI